MHWLAAILLLLLSTAPKAETVMVQSGDHAGFSRLVFPFETRTGWQMGRIGDRYEIHFSQNDLGFDFSRVFRKIDRSRIKTLRIARRAGKPAVQIELGCDCHADAFEFRPGLLVIDVKDGPPDKDSPFEKGLAGDEVNGTPEANHTTFSGLQAQDAELRPHVFSSEVSGGAELEPDVTKKTDPLYDQNGFRKAERLQLPLMLDHERTLPPLLQPWLEPSQKEKMREAVIAEIGRAASQGLLTPQIEIPEIPEQKPEAVQKKHAPETAEIQGTRTFSDQVPSMANLPEQRTLPIHVRTGVDRDNSEAAERLVALDENGEACLPDSLFDLSSWGKPEAPFHGVTTSRAALVKEFDRVDPHDATILAKAYVYAGFGAEANMVLETFDVEKEDAAILRIMAEIMDDGWAFERGGLAAQIACDAPVALWAALSLPDFSRGLTINRAAIKRAFAALPPHLRRHLGPILARRFLTAGDRETALSIRNAIERVNETSSASIALMNAAFQEQAGEIEGMQETLAKVYRSDRTLSAEALVKLLEAKIESGAEIEPQLIESAAAQAFELKGTQLGRDLARVHVLALGKAHRYAEAIDELRTFVRIEEVGKVTEQTLWETLLADALLDEDEAFLLFVFSAKNDLVRVRPDSPLQRSTAQRLIEMGFPEMARTILAIPAVPQLEDRLILARGLLAEDRPEEALTRLGEAEGKEAMRLRAQALAELGRAEEAASIYKMLKDTEALREILWTRQIWPSLGEIAVGPQKAVAELAANTEPEAGAMSSEESVPFQDAELSRFRVRLARSQATRQAVRNILEAYPGPADDES